jgi:hypothetical protein
MYGTEEYLRHLQAVTDQVAGTVLTAGAAADHHHIIVPLSL